MKHDPRRSRAAGFSLVELMLALVLGLVVVTGIVQLFLSNSQTYNVLNGQARMQENARFALEIISRSARSAGYWGCSPAPANIVRGVAGAWNLIPEFDITRIIQGHEGAGAGWTPPLSILPRTVGATNANVYIPGNGIDTSQIALAPGTDVVAFRSLQSPGQRLAQVLQPDADPVVEAPGGNVGFGVGDIVMVSDCEQAAVFQVTGLAIAGNQATVSHATVATPTPYQNSTTVQSPTGPVPYTLSFIGHSYGEDATIGAVETTYFYVRPGTGTDNQGNNPLALWQKVGSAAPVELIQGVEDLQVLYGVDTTLTDGEANANQYVTFDNIVAPAPLTPSDVVVSLRVSVTVNSIDRVTDAGNVLRRTFSKTILLRNSDPEA